MISNHIFTIKLNLYNFNYVNHKAQKMKITLQSTIKPKFNPLGVFGTENYMVYPAYMPGTPYTCLFGKCV